MNSDLHQALNSPVTHVPSSLARPRGNSCHQTLNFPTMSKFFSQSNEEAADLPTSPTQKFARKWIRIIGSIEGVSFLLLLFIAMPLKYLGENPILVKWLGPIHGWLFVLYIVSVVGVARLLRWRWFHVVLAWGASVVPFGPFVFEAWLRRNSQVKV